MRHIYISVFLLVELLVCSCIYAADEGAVAKLSIINHSGKTITFTTVSKAGNIDDPLPIKIFPKLNIAINNDDALNLTFTANPLQTTRFVNDIIIAIDNKIFEGCAFYAKISAQYPYGVAYLQQAARATSSADLNCAARLTSYDSAEFIIFPILKNPRSK